MAMFARWTSATFGFLLRRFRQDTISHASGQPEKCAGNAQKYPENGDLVATIVPRSLSVGPSRRSKLLHLHCRQLGAVVSVLILSISTGDAHEVPKLIKT